MREKIFNNHVSVTVNFKMGENWRQTIYNYNNKCNQSERKKRAMQITISKKKTNEIFFFISSVTI